jgi:hypothetical protein
MVIYRLCPPFKASFELRQLAFLESKACFGRFIGTLSVKISKIRAIRVPLFKKIL